mgnify:CR=1 FL=1
MVRGILFDLDGTLINTYDLYMEVYRHAAKPYVNKELTEKEILDLKPSTEMNFLEMISPEEERDTAYQRFIESYTDWHDRYFKGIYRGISDLLHKLRHSGYRMGLVTGKSRKAWELTRQKLGLDLFEVVITDSEVDRPKPSAEGIRKAMKLMYLNHPEVIYVGDTLVDYQAARNAGILFATALWAKTSEETNQLKKQMHPDGNTLFLNHPEDLLHYL